MFTSSLPAKSCFSCNFILNDDFQHDNLLIHVHSTCLMHGADEEEE